MSTKRPKSSAQKRSAHEGKPLADTPVSELIDRLPLERGVLALILAFGLLWGLFTITHAYTPGLQEIAGVDPVSYYSYARSILFDLDVDFENEYRALLHAVSEGNPLVDPDAGRAPTGLPNNAFAIGPGLLWLPWLAAAHLFAGGNVPADGLSQPYFTAVSYANMTYAFAGVLLMYLALRMKFRPWESAIAAFAAWLCSPLLYYMFAVEVMAHATSFFAMALFFFCWIKWRFTTEWWPWAVMGLALGMAALMRWQNAAFGMVLAFDLIGRGRTPEHFGKLALAAAASMVAFTPQMLAWWTIYGSPLTIPQGGGFFTWWQPDLIGVFFSLNYGMLVWTPLLVAGIVGLFFIPNKDRFFYIGILAAVLFQVYVQSAVGDAGWSYGMRRLVNCTPFFAVGFILLMRQIGWHPRVWTPVVALFAIWNSLFAMQYAGIIDGYYVQEAIDEMKAEHGLTVEELRVRNFLPDGTPFDFQSFTDAHRFPRGEPLDAGELIWDKRIVLGETFNMIILLGDIQGS